ATIRGCQRGRVSGRTENGCQLCRGRSRPSAASSSRSCGSNRGRPSCRRRIDSSCRSTRISSSFARSPRAKSTINSSSRTTTTYNPETSKGDLQQTATPTLPPPRQRKRSTRPRFCTPRAEEQDRTPRPLTGSAEIERVASIDDLERPQNPKLHPSDPLSASQPALNTHAHLGSRHTAPSVIQEGGTMRIGRASLVLTLVLAGA